MRAKITDKIRGVDKLFLTEEDLSKTDTDTSKGTQIDTVVDTCTVAVIGTDTDTDTQTDTVIEALIKPTDNYIRKVYYPMENQNKFVIKKAKKYKVTESEIVRIALDYLMKSGKI